MSEITIQTVQTVTVIRPTELPLMLLGAIAGYAAAKRDITTNGPLTVDLTSDEGVTELLVAAGLDDDMEPLFLSEVPDDLTEFVVNCNDDLWIEVVSWEAFSKLFPDIATPFNYVALTPI